MDAFERIKGLRDEYESTLDDAERARERYHREIVKLHRSGMSLREIAEGLGISHQRVHQIVSPRDESKPPRKVRRGAVAGAIAAILLLTGGVFFTTLNHGSPPERAAETPPVVSPSPAERRCTAVIDDAFSSIRAELRHAILVGYMMDAVRDAIDSHSEGPSMSAPHTRRLRKQTTTELHEARQVLRHLQTNLRGVKIIRGKPNRFLGLSTCGGFTGHVSQIDPETGGTLATLTE